MNIVSKINLKWLAFISLAIFLVQSAFTWFSADDYCYLRLVQASGLLKNMLHDYMFWDGRSISLTYPVCRVGLFNGVSWLGPLIGSLLMMIMAVLILRIIGYRISDFFSGFTAIITLTILLWLVFFNFLSQTLYWTTGVGYNMDVVMLLSAIWWLSRWNGQVRDFILGLPVFFYAGTCSPNGVLALMFILGVQWLYEYFISQRKDNLKYIYAFLLISIAAGLVVLSPGNKNRMSSWDWNNLTHIWTVYFNIKLLLKNLFNFNSLFVWSLIAFGLAGATLKLANKELQLSGMFKKSLNFMFEHRYLMAALISFFFFLPLPGMNSPRTAIQFAAFASLYGLSHSAHLVSYFQQFKSKLILFSAVLVHLVFIVVAGSQAFDARYVKAKMMQRDSKLKAMKGQNVTLTEVDFVRTPATRRFEDLSSDSSYWLNQCVASHYGLKSIKLIDTRPKKPQMGTLTD